MASRKMPPPRPFAMGEVRKRLRGSKIIYEERDGLATEMLAMAAAKITDVVEWDDAGKVTIKSVEDIPSGSLAAIKKVKVTPTRNGDQIEVEMIDKVRLMGMLAKSAGLLDTEKEADKPSVVGIEMVMPGDDNDTK